MKKILSTFLLLTSISIQAGLPPTSLSGQSQATKPTTFQFKTPYNQSTQIAGIQSLIETGSENMLVNPGFEGVASTVPSGWTCTTGTCTKTTTAGEFSSGLAAMKIVPAANVIDVSQSVTTTSGIQKQGFARVIYKVPSTCSTFQVLTTVDSATQTTVPTANLVYDDTFRSIEVPLTFGSTNAGIKFTASTTCTGNIFVDGAILAQGLGLQNLSADTDFTSCGLTTSDFTGFGTVSAINLQCARRGQELVIKGHFVSGTPTATEGRLNFSPGGTLLSSSSIATLEVAQGFWMRDTAAASHGSAMLMEPNVGYLTFGQGDGFSGNAASATTKMSVSSYVANGNKVYVHARVPIASYSASSNVYSQASANTDWAACTFSTLAWQGFGTVTNNLYCKRDNGNLKIRGSFTLGTVTASLAQIPLPTNFSSITSASNIPTNSGIGLVQRGMVSASNTFTALLSSSSSIISFGQTITASVNPKTPISGTAAFGNSESIEIVDELSIPISGWSNSNVIVGSFAELGIKLGTSQASTSRTSIDFTIPTGVKRVTLMFAGVSTNGTSDIVARLGSGSVLSSGYVGSTGVIRAGGSSNVYAFSAAFNIGVETIAADNFSGISTFNLMGSNTWTNSGSISSNTVSRTSISGGYVSVGGVIDRLRITTANGTDTFDAGTINVSWEF